MYQLKSVGVVIFSLLMLAGCVTTSVTGQKLGSVNQPIEQVGIAINPAKFKNYNMASSLADTQVSTLFPHLASRMPIIFALNGIESKAMLDESGRVPHELSTYPNILLVRPQWASWNSRTGSALEVAMQLVDAENGRVIWRGTTMLKTLGFGKFDEELADEFARKLLVQLNEDGLIKFKGAEVVMPEKTEVRPNDDGKSSR